MRKHFCKTAASLLLLASVPAFGTGSPWGADYFPNVPLITQDGETVHFFDDLIKDKIVAINFIYTTCPDTCPLETAQLARVQRILGDRLGNDVFFYSITIDPDNDTPEVLKEYRERFRAKWTFLTGKNEDIIELRRKLGLYVEEIQDGSNNHNVNMIIGNQTTGRWMKRSPFENPHVLADQLRNWLTGWKAPPRGEDYSDAPKLRSIPRGEQLFRTRCQICHTMTGTEPAGALGPDLLGVTERREMSWLLNWLRAPDQMLEDGDPIAMELYAQYDSLPMPNMRLNQQEAMDLIQYMEDETRRISGVRNDEPSAATMTVAIRPQKSDIAPAWDPSRDVVAVMNAWVREADALAKVNAGYMTLINVGTENLTLISVESDAFDSVEIHDMTTVDGLMRMREVTDLVIPAGAMARLTPGGRHLMLMGPHSHLQAGETVEMTLTFDTGHQQSVSVRVAAR